MDSASKRRRLNSVAQSEGIALRQIEEAAVSSRPIKRAFRSSAPESAHTTLETMTRVSDFQEINPKVIGHRGNIAVDKTGVQVTSQLSCQCLIIKHLTGEY